MDSDIRMRATVPEMNTFFEVDGGVRYMKIQDSHYTQEDLEQMSEETYNSKKFLWDVVYRHKELEKPLRGIFSVAGLKKKLAALPEYWPTSNPTEDRTEEHP